MTPLNHYLPSRVTSFPHLVSWNHCAFISYKKKKKEKSKIFTLHMYWDPIVPIEQIWVQIWPSSLGHKLKILRQLHWMYTEVLTEKTCSLCRNYRYLPAARLNDPKFQARPTSSVTQTLAYKSGIFLICKQLMISHVS